MTQMKLNPQIRAEAVDWLLRFSEGEEGAQMRKRFLAWLRTSPEHVRAYLRVSALWADAGMLDLAQKRSIEELVEQAQAVDNVIALPIGEHVGEAALRSRSAARWSAGIAASLVLAVVLAFAVVQRLDTSVYATAIGEQRSIMLPDGSRIELNAVSAVKVKFSDSERRIDLTRGQALFRVAKDPARPFIVDSDGTLVTAVGTQFDVSKKSDRTVVTVLEGRVAVSERDSLSAKSGPGPVLPRPIFLNAGEQVVIQPAAVVLPKPADIQVAVAWTEGLLVFDATPLSEVVQEFNRHNIKQLVIEDAALAMLEISGVFPASSESRIVEFLRERFDVDVVESRSEIRISRR